MTNTFLRDDAEFVSVDAAVVTYTLPATDADQTTVANKLNGVVSVKDFGAVGDGSTDDTEAIQDAINWVVSAGGGTVFFPTSIVAGVAKPYRANGLSITGNNITLAGDNMASARIDCNGGGSNLVTFSGGFGCGFHHLQLSSRSIVMSAGTAALAVSNCDQFNARDFIIDGSDGTSTGGGHVDIGVHVTNVSGYYYIFDTFRSNFCNTAGMQVNVTNVIAFNANNANIGGQWGGSLSAGNATRYGFRMVDSGTTNSAINLFNIATLATYDFGISAAGGGQILMWLDFCSSDTCGTDDYNFTNCGGVRMHNCWAGATRGSSAVTQGCGISCSNVLEVEIIGCEAQALAGPFCFLTNNTASAVIANNVSRWGNTNNALFGGTNPVGAIQLNCLSFSVTGNVMNNVENATSHYKYGCWISTASGPGVVSGNHFDAETGYVFVGSGAGRNVRVSGLPPITVATLTSQLAATNCAGSRMQVSDANATTFASLVAGGGANGVPVYSEGTNWFIG